MKEIVKSTASRYGLIVAAIGIAFTLLAYLINVSLLASFPAGIGLWIVSLIIFILAVNKVKSSQGGFASFRDAFSTFILAFIISSLITTLFNILLFTVIDPGVKEELKEITIEKTVNLLEKFGTPDEDITEAIDRIEQEDQFSLVNHVKRFFYGIVFYAIIGLIVAAIMKKDPPVQMEEVEDTVE